MSETVLDQKDLSRLGDAIRTLVSPLSHPDVDAWRRTVNRELKALLGADKATFQLPGHGSHDLVSDGLDLEALRSYFPFLRRLQSRLGVDRDWVFQRIASLGVCDRRELWAGDLDRFYRSEYFNEYIREIRAYDALMAAVPLPGHQVPAELYFHHDQRHGGTFGLRPLELLRLLHPAFEAGVRAQLALGAHRARLEASLDAVAEGALLFDLDGGLLHRNPAASALVESDPQGKRIEAATRELARAVGALKWSPVSSRQRRPEEEPASRTVRTVGGRYRLRASLLDSGTGGVPPLVVVTIESRRRDGLPDARTLKKRFGLTDRQAEVALLLARRLANREVADALSISPHTARHHTETVLRKLGLSSRRRVRRRILDAVANGGGAEGR